MLFDDEGADDDDAEACPPFLVRVGMQCSVGWAWLVVSAAIGPCWADTGDVAGIGPCWAGTGDGASNVDVADTFDVGSNFDEAAEESVVGSSWTASDSVVV